MATSKPIKKTTTAKKPLPKAQFGMGSGPLGLPNFEERQQRKIARAKRKATVADIEGEGSVASKRDSRANRISKVLGTGRSKARVMNNSGNNAGNTTDSYNKDSYNRDSYNTSNRPSSIMQSKPSGFQSADSMTGNTSNSQMESAPKKTYGPPRILKKGGVVKKKIVAKKK
jgi:hypothetical protein